MQQNNKKAVLITGCSSGIGFSIAKGLHERGYHVCASVRNPDDITKLEKLGIETLHLDLDDEATILKAVEHVKNLGIPLLALVNNGAYGQPGAVEDLSREALRAQFETNVFGTHSLTQKLLSVFRDQGYGRIVQISSVLGFVGLPMRGAYNASKYALEGLSDTMRIELFDTDIHISLIEPGPIESRFRPNAYLAYKKFIDPDKSRHKEIYKRVEERLNRKENASFTLPAEAVLKKTIHAIESKRPKIRYWVTVPTYVMGILKRLLTERALDRFINKHGN